MRCERRRERAGRRETARRPRIDGEGGCGAYARLRWGGEIADAEIARAEAAALVDAMTDEELAGRMDAGAHLRGRRLYLDRYREADAHAERALAIARATGRLFPTLIPTLASATSMLGKLAEATDVIDGGVEAARLANNPQDIGWSLHVRSSAALAAGDLETALATAAEAVEMTRDLDESFVSAYPGFALARSSSRRRSGSGRGRADRACRRRGTAAHPRRLASAGLEVLACCYLELGVQRTPRGPRLAEATAPTSGCRWRSHGRSGPRRLSRSARATRAAAAEQALAPRQRGREGRRGGRGGAVAHPPAAHLARMRRRGRARRELERAAADVRRVRRHSLSRRGRAGTAQAGPPDPRRRAPESAARRASSR